MNVTKNRFGSAGSFEVDASSSDKLPTLSILQGIVSS